MLGRTTVHCDPRSVRVQSAAISVEMLLPVTISATRVSSAWLSACVRTAIRAPPAPPISASADDVPFWAQGAAEDRGNEQRRHQNESACLAFLGQVSHVVSPSLGLRLLRRTLATPAPRGVLQTQCSSSAKATGTEEPSVRSIDPMGAR